MIKRGVAICHYNRVKNLESIIGSTMDTVPEDTKVILCDDGSTEEGVSDIAINFGIPLIAGPNLGVAFNKNRALFGLQDCDYICILEDDLMPIEKGWFEMYEDAARKSGIHHFCRVQDKIVPEVVPNFYEYMKSNGFTPLYGSSPRGDLTFLTKHVISMVGGFNSSFRGAGYAHGEWTERVVNAGLMGHPRKYVDIKEANEKFKQVGDTEGGRWVKSSTELNEDLSRNRKILKTLQKTNYIYHPLVLA